MNCSLFVIYFTHIKKQVLNVDRLIKFLDHKIQALSATAELNPTKQMPKPDTKPRQCSTLKSKQVQAVSFKMKIGILSTIVPNTRT